MSQVARDTSKLLVTKTSSPARRGIRLDSSVILTVRVYWGKGYGRTILNGTTSTAADNTFVSELGVFLEGVFHHTSNALTVV